MLFKVVSIITAILKLYSCPCNIKTLTFNEVHVLIKTATFTAVFMQQYCCIIHPILIVNLVAGYINLKFILQALAIGSQCSWGNKLCFFKPKLNMFVQECVLWNAVSVPLPHVTRHELVRNQHCHADGPTFIRAHSYAIATTSLCYVTLQCSDVMHVVTVAKDALQILGITGVTQNQTLKLLACIQHPRCIHDR